MTESDLTADYLSLKASNDLLREQSKQRLFELLDVICSEINIGLGGPPIQVGRQEWEFTVGTSTMVGERFGARHRERTVVVEVGWPRQPQHGFVPDGGLARGRIGFSQNTMLEPKPLTQLILKRRGDGEPQWRLIANKTLGEPVTSTLLRSYLNLLLTD